MDFCYIAPTNYIEPLELLDQNDFHLTLAHLVETDEKYTQLYANRPDGKINILDNSGFELYREGKPMFDPEKMIDLGHQVSADYLVLPDYPGEAGSKTIATGEKYAQKFHDAGFGTFFVPQSTVGDIQDYFRCFEYAATSDFVDYIGVSILACPNAFGVDGNPYQQYLARPYILHQLAEIGLLETAKANGKRIHCLGMTDGPNEIALLTRYIQQGYLDTWDSSAPVWAGINNIQFDNTPTGLRDGKIKSAVDFDFEFDSSKMDTIQSNIGYIEALINEIQL